MPEIVLRVREPVSFPLPALLEDEPGAEVLSLSVFPDDFDPPLCDDLDFEEPFDAPFFNALATNSNSVESLSA